MNKRCVASTLWCNGVDDCGDNSDEVPCNSECLQVGEIWGGGGVANFLSSLRWEALECGIEIYNNFYMLTHCFHFYTTSLPSGPISGLQ